MSELSAVPFSALPPASDGYTVLYENDQVCRSDKKLSELIGSRTSSFLTKDQGDNLYQEKGNYLVPDDLDEYATLLDLENYYRKTETSGAGELSAEFNKYLKIPTNIEANKQYAYSLKKWFR